MMPRIFASRRRRIATKQGSNTASSDGRIRFSVYELPTLLYSFHIHMSIILVQTPAG